MAHVVLNGELVPAETAAISPADRGFLLGDGVFETLRAYHRRPFRIDDHLDRLDRALDFFALRLPWTRSRLAQLCLELLDANRLDSARLRLTVTRGRHGGAMDLAPAAAPTLLITASPLAPTLEDQAPAAVALATAEVRFSEHNPTFRHKTLGRLPHLLARSQAKAAGADDALILDERGNVACSSTGNLFAVHAGQLFTPPLIAPILPGVARKTVLELARAEGIKLREDFFAPIMLAGADEVFITNSVHELVAATSLDRRPVGAGRPGPIAARLKSAYRRRAETETKTLARVPAKT